MTIKLNRSAPSIIAYIVLVFLGIFFILPFIWVLVSSLNTSATFSVTWPAHPSLENFQIVISTGLVAQPFKNSLILAGSTMLLTILLSGLAAYPLSRYHFRFKSALMYGILFVSALPILAFITPLYALYVALDPIVHMIDTFHGVILFLVASALPFNIWLMKNYLDSVSIELEEAAWVD